MKVEEETPMKREQRIEVNVGVVVWSDHCFMFHATTIVVLHFFFFTTEFLKLLCLFNKYTVLKII